MPPKKPPKKGAAAAASDADAAASDKAGEQQQAFIRQSLQATVAALKDRVRDLEESNQLLRRTRTRLGTETKDFVSYFQGELEQRDAKIDELREKLRTSEFEGAKAVRRLQAQLDEQRAGLEASAERQQAALQAKIDELQEGLDALDHYKSNKQSIDAQVAGLTEALGKEKLARREEVAEVERRWMLDKRAGIDERKEEYVAMKRRARQEAQARLDDDVKRIVIQSKKATGELRFLREQTRVLKREAAALTEQNQVLAREVEIAADKEREYALQAARREGERREMVARIQGLESSVGSMAREYERRRADDVEAAGRDAEDLATEVQGLRTLVRMKNDELRTVRRLAQAILGQRTEVEQFLVEALSEVKAEVRARRAERRKAQARAATVGAGGLSLPALVGRPGAGAGGAVGGRAPTSPLRARAAPKAEADVGLRELDPEDRERVLSLLFAKINQSEAAAAAGAGGGAETVASMRTGRVSKLSVGRGFSADGGIGRPFGLTGDVPASLPGDGGATSAASGADRGSSAGGTAGTRGRGGGAREAGTREDAKAEEGGSDAPLGPLASALLAESERMGSGFGGSVEAAGLA
ncbi:hypothetical protein FNF27_02818 [Cafeteria roenbergensis]|uniref:Cilia- and flagella-associated protein 157 n=1 Tax=Cafeteria roenbergensis TaxID=33653 RepID=A0A5A8EE03_CAFRO|nr:hypothetical protein FNF27_02818 [Cafeteria roenbergensis]